MSMKAPPSFFADWLRFDLRTAIRKRWGSWVVAGQPWTYSQILALPRSQQKELLALALEQEEHLVACWVVEARLIEEATAPGTCWPMVMEVLAERLEPAALALLRKLDSYVIASELLQLEDAYQNYLLGQYFGNQALSAKGVNKATLQSNKKTALVFLGKARERLDEASRRGDLLVFAKGRLPAAELARSAAAAYEQIAYLQYKGERAAALSE